MPAGQRFDCCLAVIAGNDFHKRSGGKGKAGILSHQAWDNHKKAIIFQKLKDAWQDLRAHATAGACIAFFGTGQSYRFGWPSATEDDLDRFNGYVRQCFEFCRSSGATAEWYSVDHLDFTDDGWHPTLDTCHLLASDLVGIVSVLRACSLSGGHPARRRLRVGHFVDSVAHRRVERSQF